MTVEPANVLVVGAEPEGSATAFSESELSWRQVATLQQLREVCETSPVDAVLLVTSKEAAVRELATLLASRDHIASVVLAPDGAIDEQAALELGVADVLWEPVEPAGLLQALRRALVLKNGSDQPHQPGAPRPQMLGGAKSMVRLRERMDQVAKSDSTVLIRGETGTGKELVATAIRAASKRANGPFMTIHCAALPTTLLESELFGHEKGAFTGATARRQGRIERAHGGTLFLDEIGELSLDTQVKLLRVIQHKQFERVGGNECLNVDLRIIAATHRNLEAMVEQGQYREDLFHRLNVIGLWVPPLRARRGDIPILARHFCQQHGANNGRPHTYLDDAALARLRKQRWPGNVRQLENFVERLVVLATDDCIGIADVERELQDTAPFVTELSSTDHSISVVTKLFGGGPPAEGSSLSEQMEQHEREAIQRALVAAGGNRAKAARLLGLGRATLYKKLKSHGLG